MIATITGLVSYQDLPSAGYVTTYVAALQYKSLDEDSRVYSAWVEYINLMYMLTPELPNSTHTLIT